jgi:hypothetical protein
MIVIECKDYNRRVDVKGVEEFYGLLDDVGAQKGVLVCPTGFSDAAKSRAEGYQIDLYSPVDTDPHKWQVKATIPAICDFRSAAMAMGIRMSSPHPFSLRDGFFNDSIVYDSEGNELGTTLPTAMERWNSGNYPTEPGEHHNLPVFDSMTVHTDNGRGTRVPVDLYVALHVTKQLYFGQLPLLQISGFKDEISGGVITNAFTLGILSPDEVEDSWLKIEEEEQAPIKPVIGLSGLVGWAVN